MPCKAEAGGCTRHTGICLDRDYRDLKPAFKSRMRGVPTGSGGRRRVHFSSELAWCPDWPIRGALGCPFLDEGGVQAGDDQADQLIHGPLKLSSCQGGSGQDIYGVRCICYYAAATEYQGTY